MADDKTTKTPEQPVTDSGPGKETPPAPPKEPEKVSVSPEPEKKTEPEVKNPQVSVYNFAEIMKEKKVEERAAAPSGEKPVPAKTEKPEKQPEAPKKAEEKPKEPEQPKRRGRPPKADKDKDAAPKPKAPAQKPEKAVKKEPEKKTAPTVQTAPTPKEPEKPKDAPRRGKEQIVYIKLNELYAFNPICGKGFTTAAKIPTPAMRYPARRWMTRLLRRSWKKPQNTSAGPMCGAAPARPPPLTVRALSAGCTRPAASTTYPVPQRRAFTTSVLSFPPPRQSPATLFFSREPMTAPALCPMLGFMWATG